MSAANNSFVDPSLASACANRVKLLSAGLIGAKVDALLVQNHKDIRYLTGFIGHDSFLLIHDGTSTIITDARYEEALEPWRIVGTSAIIIGTRHRLDESVARQARAAGIRRLGVQSQYMSLAQRDRMADTPGMPELSQTCDLVGTMRQRKDNLEVAAIEHAADIHQQAMMAALPQLEVGMSEIEFAAIVEYEMRRRGAEGPSFDIMVVSGARSSIIHYETSSKAICEGVLLLDWGALAGGYCSDMTRTIGLGRMSDEINRVYPIVLEAQLAAIEAAAPGKTCAEIDSVARGIIERAGYGECFTHGLGHGLGMDIHEPPFFNELSTEAVLEPGMVMTVEPGIYQPGIGGIRIEDDIVITETGCRVLTEFPKNADWAAGGYQSAQFVGEGASS